MGRTATSSISGPELRQRWRCGLTVCKMFFQCWCNGKYTYKKVFFLKNVLTITLYNLKKYMIVLIIFVKPFTNCSILHNASTTKYFGGVWRSFPSTADRRTVNDDNKALHNCVIFESSKFCIFHILVPRTIDVNYSHSGHISLAIWQARGDCVRYRPGRTIASVRQFVSRVCVCVRTYVRAWYIHVCVCFFFVLLASFVCYLPIKKCSR